MPRFYDFSPVNKALATARTILIALPQRPNKDKVAAALALLLSFRKLGKDVFAVCSDAMTVEFSSLVGVNKIDKKMGGKNLVISFDYVEDSIEKVSYNIEEGKFNLVIQPKEGSPPLSTGKINYSYSGSQADLVFTVGSASLNSLGEIYQENKALFEKDRVVNLDNSSGNTQFGKVNLINIEASSCSEIVANFLSRLRLPVDADIATNLFYGLEKSTQNFSSPKVGPDTFEAAAFCLRAGARRQGRKPTEIEEKREVPLKPMPRVISASQAPDLPEKPKPESPKKKPPKKPSPDWLEPKIYKGNTRI